MIFLDASAMVALLGQEALGARIAQALDAPDDFITSPIAIWEATVAVARNSHMSVDEAQRMVIDLLAAVKAETVPIGAAEMSEAILAYQHFGKGRHPAKLNMGDCFAYACARTQRAELLAVGDDFARTDIRLARY